MNTKGKLLKVLHDSEKMKTLIDNSCIEQMKMFEYADRRVLLGKRMNEQGLECPKCHTRQVQLTGYMDIKPAQWLCRHCKHKFEWEGE